MKKFIAAAAGLMLAGTMVSTACAAVSVSGDARVRYYYQENYVNLADSDDGHFNSRVRAVIKGDTESGAFAKARMKFNTADWNDGDSRNLGMDYAYFGIPMGPVVFTAGSIPTHITALVEDDSTRDGLRLSYSDDMNSVKFLYDNLGENDAGLGTFDEDTNRYSVRYELTNDMINVVAAGLYTNDETDADKSGFVGTVRVAQDFGAVSYSVDYAYVEEDLTANADAGHMGYGVVAVPTGEAGSVAFVAGFTLDGAVMDIPVGFTMIGGDTHLTPNALSHIGEINFVEEPTGEIDDEGKAVYVDNSMIVDTWFAGLKASYQVSEKTTIKGTAAYADMETPNGEFSSSAWEIGGQVTYAISASSSIYGTLGYLDIDELDDKQFGAGFGLDVKF